MILHSSPTKLVKNEKAYKYLRPFWRLHGFKLEFKLEPGHWCNKKQGIWKPIGGLTSYFSKDDRNSILFEYRFGKDFETYDITPCVIDNRGIIVRGKVVTIRSGIFAEAFCTRYKDDNVGFWIRQNDIGAASYTFSFVGSNVVRKIRPQWIACPTKGKIMKSVMFFQIF